MSKLRRYCWRFGLAVELNEDDLCPECSAPGSLHRILPNQEECGNYAGITDSHGGPCILEVGHEGPHVPHPDQVEYYRKQGQKIIIGEEG